MQYNSRQQPDAKNSDFDWHRETMLDIATCLYIAGAKRMPPSVVLLHVDYDEQGYIQGHEFRLIDLDQSVEGSDEKKLEVGAACIRKAVSERDDVLLAGFMFDEPLGPDTRRLNFTVCSLEEMQHQFRLVGRVDGGYRVVPL